MTEHAPHAPSSASRRNQCPGSMRLEAENPEPPNPKTEEGELAHLGASQMLDGEVLGPGFTDEMLDGAELWTDTIRALAKGADLHIEERVDMPSIHPDCWGTPDVWFTNQDGIHVVDYKFGHRGVDPFANWQLLEYLCGVVTRLNAFDDEQFECRLTIVQPRHYGPQGPVRTWTLTVGEAKKYWAVAARFEKAAARPETWCQPGPECRDCSARHVCRTLQVTALTMAEFSGQAVAFALPAEAAAHELTWLTQAAEMIEARRSGLVNELTVRAKAGVTVPGWRLEQDKSRTRWSAPIEEVVALGNMMGVDLNKPGAITPAQAVKKGMDPDLLKSYTEQPSGALALVKDDGRKAREAFK